MRGSIDKYETYQKHTNIINNTANRGFDYVDDNYESQKGGGIISVFLRLISFGLIK